MPPVIDYEKCTACGDCVDVCTEDIFYAAKDVEDAQPVVSHPEFCYHCYLCVTECPAEAMGLRIPMPLTVPYK